MMTFNELIKKWNQMPIYKNAFVLLDCSHNIEIHIGYEELNQKTLLILNSGIVADLPSSKSIAVSNYQYKGTWVLSFRLVQSDNEEVFLRFCWDIIESSRGITENQIEFIVQRYFKWQRLMEHKWPDLLSVQRQKGLIGEIMYLNECLNNMGCRKALDVWCGPEGADQDFIYDGTWTEIKVIAAASNTISISSLEQLDQDAEGSIVIYWLEKTTEFDPTGFSLADVVTDTRVLFAADQLCQELFELKLFQYGYKEMQEYGRNKYRLCNVEEYFVDNNFPRLIKGNIPAQIISARYSIDLPSIECYRK